MTMRSLLAALNIGFMFLLVSGIAAQAAEVKVLSAVPMRAVMEDLGPKFERESGHKLAVTFNNLGTIVKRLQDGEAADVVILPRQGIESIASRWTARPVEAA